MRRPSTAIPRNEIAIRRHRRTKHRHSPETVVRHSSDVLRIVGGWPDLPGRSGSPLVSVPLPNRALHSVPRTVLKAAGHDRDSALAVVSHTRVEAMNGSIGSTEMPLRSVPFPKIVQDRLVIRPRLSAEQYYSIASTVVDKVVFRSIHGAIRVSWNPASVPRRPHIVCRVWHAKAPSRAVP